MSLRKSAYLAISLITGCTVAFDLSALDEQCPPDKKVCSGRCVARNDPATGCGQEGCEPCFPNHGSAHCSPEGQCILIEGSCFSPWADCDQKPENGCETNTATDVENCGTCNNKACGNLDLLHASPACAHQSCGISRCEPHWADCDRSALTGCETDLLSDAAHCGACRNKCLGLCTQGQCVE